MKTTETSLLNNHSINKSSSLKIDIGDLKHYSSGGNFEGVIKYNEVINFKRRVNDSSVHNCVMCGENDVTIPCQNKDVCKLCDTSFWLSIKLNTVFKFCKGCKNFVTLCNFSDKPAASKCCKCRKRGRENYQIKKSVIQDLNNLSEMSFVESDPIRNYKIETSTNEPSDCNSCKSSKRRFEANIKCDKLTSLPPSLPVTSIHNIVETVCCNSQQQLFQSPISQMTNRSIVAIVTPDDNTANNPPSAIATESSNSPFNFISYNGKVSAAYINNAGGNDDQTPIDDYNNNNNNGRRSSGICSRNNTCQQFVYESKSNSNPANNSISVPSPDYSTCSLYIANTILQSHQQQQQQQQQQLNRLHQCLTVSPSSLSSISYVTPPPQSSSSSSASLDIELLNENSIDISYGKPPHHYSQLLQQQQQQQCNKERINATITSSSPLSDGYVHVVSPMLLSPPPSFPHNNNNNKNKNNNKKKENSINNSSSREEEEETTNNIPEYFGNVAKSLTTATKNNGDARRSSNWKNISTSLSTPIMNSIIISSSSGNISMPTVTPLLKSSVSSPVLPSLLFNSPTHLEAVSPEETLTTTYTRDSSSSSSSSTLNTYSNSMYKENVKFGIAYNKIPTRPKEQTNYYSVAKKISNKSNSNNSNKNHSSSSSIITSSSLWLKVHDVDDDNEDTISSNTATNYSDYYEADSEGNEIHTTMNQQLDLNNTSNNNIIPSTLSPSDSTTLAQISNSNNHSNVLYYSLSSPIDYRHHPLNQSSSSSSEEIFSIENIATVSTVTQPQSSVNVNINNNINVSASNSNLSINDSTVRIPTNLSSPFHDDLVPSPQPPPPQPSSSSACSSSPLFVSSANSSSSSTSSSSNSSTSSSSSSSSSSCSTSSSSCSSSSSSSCSTSSSSNSGSSWNWNQWDPTQNPLMQLAAVITEEGQKQ